MGEQEKQNLVISLFLHLVQFSWGFRNCGSWKVFSYACCLIGLFSIVELNVECLGYLYVYWFLQVFTWPFANYAQPDFKFVLAEHVTRYHIPALHQGFFWSPKLRKNTLTVGKNRTQFVQRSNFKLFFEDLL